MYCACVRVCVFLSFLVGRPVTDIVLRRAYPDFVILLQALYYALPMNYVTISKLQNKFEGEANQNTVRKMIDKMTRDGFVEAKSNRRLGACTFSQTFRLQKLMSEDRIMVNLFILMILFILGKRVIHSVMTEKKLMEVKKVLNKDAMVSDCKAFSYCTMRVFVSS